MLTLHSDNLELTFKVNTTLPVICEIGYFCPAVQPCELQISVKTPGKIGTTATTCKTGIDGTDWSFTDYVGIPDDAFRIGRDPGPYAAGETNYIVEFREIQENPRCHKLWNGYVPPVVQVCRLLFFLYI